MNGINWFSISQIVRSTWKFSSHHIQYVLFLEYPCKKLRLKIGVNFKTLLRLKGRGAPVKFVINCVMTLVVMLAFVTTGIFALDD